MTSFDGAEPANNRVAATEALAAEHLDDLPLPQDVRTVFQGGTFFFFFRYLEAEMVLSIVLAG